MYTLMRLPAWAVRELEFSPAWGLVAALLLSGCASFDSLRPGVERVCTKGTCYLIGDSEQVDRRCSKNGVVWDSGEKRTAFDGLKVRCCTVFRSGRRVRIWVTRGQEACLAHEQCHVEIFQSGVGDHKSCHNFGIGKEKKRL